jgi:hypothetical protein
MRHEVCIASSVNDGCHSGETGSRLGVRVKEHRHNLKQGLMEKSELAQHAYEERFQICWKEAKVL